MSSRPTAASAPAPTGSPFDRLPARLRPRARGSARGLRRIGLVGLIGLGLLLSVGTVYDVVLQTGKDNRLSADVYTWRHLTGRYFKNITTENGEEDGEGTRDVTCGNTTYGRPGSHTQLCIIMTGPVVNRKRAVRGSYYLPAYASDQPEHRYGCTGLAASEHLCPSP